MKTAEDIESYLIRMECSYEAVGENIWLVKDPGVGLVVSIAGPVVVFRVKILELDKIPAPQREGFYQMLLELNSTDMLHGAYGLEEGVVVAGDALQLQNLDFNEFQATLEDLSMSVSKHYAVLSKLAA